MATLGFGKDDHGNILGIVYEGEEAIGAFKLDARDPDQVVKAMNLGVDMRYACYAYEAATGEKP